MAFLLCFSRLNKHESCFEEKNQELMEARSLLKATQMNFNHTENTLIELRQKMENLNRDKTRLQKCEEEHEKKISLFIRYTNYNVSNKLM